MVIYQFSISLKGEKEVVHTYPRKICRRSRRSHKNAFRKQTTSLNKGKYPWQMLIRLKFLKMNSFIIISHLHHFLLAIKRRLLFTQPFRGWLCLICQFLKLTLNYLQFDKLVLGALSSPLLFTLLSFLS